jgi:hypothetical protein
MDLNTQYFDETVVSGIIGCSLPTLRRWRLEKRGPRYHKFGSLVRYGNCDLAEWTEAQPCGGIQVSLKLAPVNIHVSGVRALGKA